MKLLLSQGSPGQRPIPSEIASSFVRGRSCVPEKKTYPEVAFHVLSKVLEGEIDEPSLKAITFDAYNYEVPLEKLNDNTYIMRLDRGPTASFKDFAARLIGKAHAILSHKREQANNQTYSYFRRYRTCSCSCILWTR